MRYYDLQLGVVIGFCLQGSEILKAIISYIKKPCFTYGLIFGSCETHTSSSFL